MEDNLDNIDINEFLANYEDYEGHLDDDELDMEVVDYE